MKTTWIVTTYFPLPTFDIEMSAPLSVGILLHEQKTKTLKGSLHHSMHPHQLATKMVSCDNLQKIRRKAKPSKSMLDTNMVRDVRKNKKVFEGKI
jgi:hypothetical protein